MVRRVLSLFGAFLLFVATALPALALQEASPAASPQASAFTNLGLPELNVTVTASGYEGIPTQIEAGRYLVTVAAAEDVGEFGGGVAFVSPPEGMTADEFLMGLSGPPEDSGDGAATPMAETEASPADGGEEMGGPPPFLMQAHFAGGIYATTGGTAQIVLDLPPGEWIAWGDDPEASQEPFIFEATGEIPTDLSEPTASATLTMGEYLIEVTEGELVAGQNIVRVDNIGAQPHFIVAAKGPDDLTAEQVGVVLEEEMQAEMSGTPVAYSDLNPDEDFGDGPFTGTQSMNTSTWVEFNLEAGRYVLVCFFPDISDGIPHAYKGMYTVVDVAG
jgi:hypothetical protein